MFRNSADSSTDYIADATYQGLAYYTMSAMTNG